MSERSWERARIASAAVAVLSVLSIHCGGNGSGRNGAGKPCSAASASCDRGFICLSGTCQDVLGTSWLESENLWLGTWSRMGTTNEFNASWAHESEVETGRVFITVDGTQVSVDRLNSGSVVSGCTYSGTLSPDGVHVSGTFLCNQYLGHSGNVAGCTWLSLQNFACTNFMGPWTATIQR
jgi:hypothetical protein